MLLMIVLTAADVDSITFDDMFYAGKAGMASCLNLERGPVNDA